MRAPYQILAIPYQLTEEGVSYCVFRRADSATWQFIAGGGEDGETPEEAAIREIREEGGVHVTKVLPLTSMCYIPVCHFPKRRQYLWPETLYVVPEYAFAFACTEEVHLSREHTDYAWLSYEEASARLCWDSNKTALYELHRRLEGEGVCRDV